MKFPLGKFTIIFLPISGQSQPETGSIKTILPWQGERKWERRERAADSQLSFAPATSPVRCTYIIYAYIFTYSTSSSEMSYHLLSDDTCKTHPCVRFFRNLLLVLALFVVWTSILWVFIGLSELPLRKIRRNVWNPAKIRVKRTPCVRRNANKSYSSWTF